MFYIYSPDDTANVLVDLTAQVCAGCVYLVKSLISADGCTQLTVHTLQVLTLQLAEDRCYHESTSLIYSTVPLSQ